MKQLKYLKLRGGSLTVPVAMLPFIFNMLPNIGFSDENSNYTFYDIAQLLRAARLGRQLDHSDESRFQLTP